MPLKLEEISPESELQQNLEQLNVTENDGHKRDVDVHAVEGESANNDKKQDRKTTLVDNNIVNEKKWSDETTCHSEDGSHEIGLKVTNDNDKDKDYTSSADESDFSLPKHRKDYPSDDERTDSEPLSNEEDETGSEDSNYRLIPLQKLSEIYTPYEQTTPIKSSNTLQINGTNDPFEVSPMTLGDSSLQDDDIDIARIVNPIVRCIADLRSEFRTQLAKIHYCPDTNLDKVKFDENWQHTEFEKSQDQYCYNAIATAGKLLDVIMPMQLPEEAKEHIAQARHILWKKALLCRTNTENINLSSSSISQADNDIDSATATVTTPNNNSKSGTELVSSNTNENNKSSGSSVEAKSSGENNNKTSVEIVNKAEVITTKNKESSNNHNVTNPNKYRRGTSQGRKLRRHSVRGSSTYSSPKSGRRSQNYSPRTPNSRSPRVGSTVTSSIAGSATQANNRRFVGFLPSRCFTCGGIGHYATNCPNKGSFITTSTSNNHHQPSRSRRRNFDRYKRTTETNTNNSTSNE